MILNSNVGVNQAIHLFLSKARINWDGCVRKGIRRKNGGIDGGGLLIGPDGLAPTRIVGVSASVILASTIKPRRSFLLAPARPGWSWKKGSKTVVVV